MSEHTDVVKAPVVTNGAMKVAGKKDDTIVSSKMHTERELDEAVRDVEKLKATGATALYNLGKRIVEIQDTGLWKLRTEKDENGKVSVRWKSFDAFCNQELGLSPQSASSLGQIARHYSENDVKLFGTRKLGLVLQAPREERPRIEAAVRGGASKKEIEKEVRKVNRERGSAEPHGNKQTSKATAAAAEKRREKAKKVKNTSQIAVAKILGLDTVKLVKRPAKIGGDLSDAVRARKLSDEPYGCREIAAGVYEHFYVTTDAGGGLILKVKTVRDE